jgi:hypothetical protein
MLSMVNALALAWVRAALRGNIGLLHCLSISSSQDRNLSVDQLDAAIEQFRNNEAETYTELAEIVQECRRIKDTAQQVIRAYLKYRLY